MPWLSAVSHCGKSRFSARFNAKEMILRLRCLHCDAIKEYKVEKREDWKS